MNLTLEQKLQKQERNKKVIQDYIDGMTRAELAVKYGFCVDTVLCECGIKFNKKPGRPFKVLENNITGINTDDKDMLWVNKQIIALTRQGASNREIRTRYNITNSRIKKVRKESGICLVSEAALQNNMHNFNGMAIPDLTPLITVRPRRYY